VDTHEAFFQLRQHFFFVFELDTPRPLPQPTHSTMDLIHELKKAARQGNGDRIRWLLHDKPSAEVAAVLNDT